MRILVVFLLVCSFMAVGKDRPGVIIHVLSSSVSSSSFSYTVPGSGETASTNCSTNGTVSGGNVQANTNCRTKTSGTPAQTVNTTSEQRRLSVVMPNGTHVVLGCRNELVKCPPIAPGDYEAEIKGNDVWLHLPDLSGKEKRIRYSAIGE